MSLHGSGRRDLWFISSSHCKTNVGRTVKKQGTAQFSPLQPRTGVQTYRYSKMAGVNTCNITNLRVRMFVTRDIDFGNQTMRPGCDRLISYRVSSVPEAFPSESCPRLSEDLLQAEVHTNMHTNHVNTSAHVRLSLTIHSRYKSYQNAFRRPSPVCKAMPARSRVLAPSSFCSKVQTAAGHSRACALTSNVTVFKRIELPNYGNLIRGSTTGPKC